MPLPPPLPENAGLARVGERPWRRGALAAKPARALATAFTANGRPYGEVLRGLVGAGRDGRRERWQVDFPLHFTEAEAALYPRAATRLRPGASLRPQFPWWRNPGADPPLRRALARLGRYWATPRSGPVPQWTAYADPWLPDHSLLALLREDDCTGGVLRSRFFADWWAAAGIPAEALVVTSYPFPWPPDTTLSALDSRQQEGRIALGRAARAGDQRELDRQVAAAYGWPESITGPEARHRLELLHRTRSDPGTTPSR